MEKILGIVNFESSYVDIEGLTSTRSASAVSVFGKYRVVDFMVSNFSNSDVNSVQVYVKSKPASIIDHLYSTDYSINSKSEGFKVIPCLNEVHDYYNTDVANFADNMYSIESANANYVVVAPSNYIFTQDFAKLVEEHKKSKADITILYQKVNDAKTNFLMCDCLTFKEKTDSVINMRKNRANSAKANVSLETYVMAKDVFIDLIKGAMDASSISSLHEVITEHLVELKVKGYEHKGFAACINSLKAYYDVNQKLIDKKIHSTVINEQWPIYTRSGDACPTLYKEGAHVDNCIISNGSIIEGEVINCVIGRNVVIKKGAVVKDSIILPDTTIGTNVHIENAVVDSLVSATHKKLIAGTKENPAYIKRGDKI